MKINTTILTLGAGALLTLASTQTASAVTCDRTYHAAQALHQKAKVLHTDYRNLVGRYPSQFERKLLAEFCELQEDICDVVDDLRANRTLCRIEPRVNEVANDLKRIDNLICNYRLPSCTRINLANTKDSFRSFDRVWTHLLASQNSSHQDIRQPGHDFDHRFDHREPARALRFEDFRDQRFGRVIDQRQFQHRQVDDRRYDDRYSHHQTRYDAREVDSGDVLRFIAGRIAENRRY